MKNCIITLIFILSLIASGANAENISGRVVRNDNNLPISGATVNADGEKKTKTDENGKFSFKNINLPVNIIVTHVGFSRQEKAITTAGADISFELQVKATMLNSIVVTAKRYEKAAYKVSQPITISSSEEISAKGHTIVSDIIRAFPGVDMNDAGPFRARPVIRGLYGTRILVLVDGKRLNDQRDIADFAGASMSLIDASEIDRVEVVNGPSSVLYGSDAMGGVINIITKRKNFPSKAVPYFGFSNRYSTADNQNSSRINLGLNGPRFYLTGGVHFRKADKDYKLPDNWTNEDSRYNVYRDGFYDTLNSDQGTSFSSERLANSKAKMENYDLQMGFQPNANHRVDADFGAFRASDIGYPGVPNDSTPYYFAYPVHERDNFCLTYTGTGLTNKMARLEGKIFYDKISKDFLTDFYDGVMFPAGPGAFGFPETSTSRTEVEKIGMNFQELYVLSDKTTFTFGMDGWRENIDGQVTSITRFEGFGPFPVYDTSLSTSVPKNRWIALGGYAAGDFLLGNHHVNAGLRWDNYWINTEESPKYVDDSDNPLPTEDENYSALNGSLGLVYPITEEVNVVADIGTAYRVPNVVERFFYGSASGRQTRPNPDIKPERALTFNVGVKAIHNNLNYSLIGFYSDYSDFSQLTAFDSVAMGPGMYMPLWRFENIQDVTIYGFESYFEADFENGAYGNLSISYQHGQNDTDNQPIFVSPIKTTLTAGYRYGMHGLFGELTIRRAENQNRIPNVTALDDIASEGFTVFNATAGMEIYKNVKLSITGNNLLDAVYSEPFNGRNPDNPIAEPGRNFIISLSAEFGG